MMVLEVGAISETVFQQNTDHQRRYPSPNSSPTYHPRVSVINTCGPYPTCGYRHVLSFFFRPFSFVFMAL